MRVSNCFNQWIIEFLNAYRVLNQTTIKQTETPVKGRLRLSMLAWERSPTRVKRPISAYQVKQENPPNWSILISGGKENNSDSLSNGEWTGNPAQALNPSALVDNAIGLVVYFGQCLDSWSGHAHIALQSYVNNVHQRGWKSRMGSATKHTCVCSKTHNGATCQRVSLLESAGWIC